MAERRCIATGETGPKSGLVRFVVGPDDRIVPDVLERLPGRGIWVSATHQAVKMATKKKLFARGAKKQVNVPEDLCALIEQLLVKRMTDTLAMARKAGQAVAGKEKVKALLIEDAADALLQAADGSRREMAQLRAPKGENRHITCLTANELGLAFGRDRVIHAALIAGGLSGVIRYESARLGGFRSKQG